MQRPAHDVHAAANTGGSNAVISGVGARQRSICTCVACAAQPGPALPMSGLTTLALPCLSHKSTTSMGALASRMLTNYLVSVMLQIK
jgi:hypothetical protein